MRSAFLSLLALANAVYVTETDYATFYVTVNAQGQQLSVSTSISTGSESPAKTPASVPNYAYQGTSSASSEATSVLAAAVTSSSAYVAPTPSSSSTSEYVAPTTRSSSSSVYVAPTTSSTSSSTYVAPTTTAPPTTSVTTSSAAPSSTSAATPFEQDILSYHNRVRAEHHVGPLSWNDDLASYAQNYLNGDNCVFKHSGGPYGENIALGYATIDQALDAWYNEEDQYNYAAGQFSESTGHFTQMVWKATSEVGCATYDCSGRTFLVCEYKARGNVIGYFTENVLPK